MNNFNKIVKKKIKKFNIYSFNSRKNVDKYIKIFNLKKLIIKKTKEDKIKSIKNKIIKNVSKKEIKPFDYDLEDLCRLHWLTLSKKAINTLEFGSGWSTIFIAHACEILMNSFGHLRDFRVDKKFHIYSLEENKRYLEITKKRIPQNLKKFVTIIHSKNKIVDFQGKYATKSINIPNISPDFIYLDGPSQYATNNIIDGFDIKNISRFPMSADLLYIEYFMEPGTFILVDGRTANARFLKDHFKRNWKYSHDIKGDCHYFELKEEPLGIHNKKKLKFKNS